MHFAFLFLPGCGAQLTQTDEAEQWLLQTEPASTAAAKDWPGWRGVNGAGVGTGAPPVEFSPTQNVRWQCELPGEGSSSPVIWGDLVLMTTAVGGGSQPELRVVAVDRGGGQIRWQATVGQAKGQTHAKNGYASPSVATDGRRVFAFFGAAGLFCCDMAGQRQWHVEFAGLDHQWGYGGSPVLFQDKVIVVCDGEDESHIVAFDQATGQQRWRTERPSRGSWSTPVFVEVDDDGTRRTEMVVNGTTREPSGEGLVIAYDPRDGRELWRVRGTETFVTPTALVCNGLVYSLSGRNGPIMAIKPGGTGDVTDSRIVWKATRGGPYIPSAVAYRQRLFVISDNGRLTCYNAGNGEQIWSTRLRGDFTASLVAADGRIYATNERGVVYVFAAEDEPRQLAANDLKARCYATPAIVDGQMFVRTQNTLYCFEATPAGVEAISPGSRSAPGDTVARSHMTTPAGVAALCALRGLIGCDPSGIGERACLPIPGCAARPGANGWHPFGMTFAEARFVALLFAAQPAAPAEKKQETWPLARGNAEATGVATGTLPEKLELLWTFSAPRGGFESTAAIVDGAVYAGGSDGKVYRLALADGKKQWEFDTKSIVTAAPGVCDGRIFVGDTDGKFYCLDAKTGQKLWEFTTDSEINGGPNFYKDAVLIGSQDANLYCLNRADGKLVWKYESADQIRSFPTIAGDRTFVAGCDGQLHVIRLGDGKPVGEIELNSPTGATAAVGGDYVFVGTEGNEFLAIDWKQEKVAWRFENRPRSAAYRSSAAVTKDLVIVGSRDRFVHAFDPKTGERRWHFAAKGRVDGSPTIVGQRVFVGASDGRLYELSLKTGEERWRFEVGGDILGAPAVAEGRLVIGNDRGDLCCFGLRKTRPE